MNRHDTIARIYLTIAAITFTALGINALLFPGQATAGIGLHADSLAALGEVRATYGGLQLAFAAVLARGAARAPARQPALLFAATMCTGLAFGRIVAIAATGQLPAAMAPWLLLEIVATVIAVLLARLGTGTPAAIR